MGSVVVILSMACVSLFGSGMPGHCQCDSSSESNIEQSESEINQNLESEISADRTQDDVGVEHVESSMDSGKAGAQ